MASTRAFILKQAKKLFNEKGYKNVSLRSIAEAAETTIGNLTYHFPRKEDLVSTIQLELYTDFFNINFDMENGELLFNEILNSFFVMDQNRDNNLFFYKNIVELCHESTEIANNIVDFRYRVFHFFLKSFIKLQEHNILRSDITNKQYETLSYTVSNLSFIWRQEGTLYYDEKIPKVELHEALSNLIYPYLTNIGINLFNNYFEKNNN